MFENMNLKLLLFLVFIFGCDIKKPQEVEEAEEVQPCTCECLSPEPTSVNLQIHVSIPAQLVQDSSEEMAEPEVELNQIDPLPCEINQPLNTPVSEPEENDIICVGCDDEDEDSDDSSVEPGEVEIVVDPTTGAIQYIIKGIEIELE
tara:strand:- start:160 stop:600 length:441 start_codon:yes stop_codon:yes gene_type:complete